MRKYKKTSDVYLTVTLIMAKRKGSGDTVEVTTKGGKGKAKSGNKKNKSIGNLLTNLTGTTAEPLPTEEEKTVKEKGKKELKDEDDSDEDEESEDGLDPMSEPDENALLVRAPAKTMVATGLEDVKVSTLAEVAAKGTKVTFSVESVPVNKSSTQDYKSETISATVAEAQREMAANKAAEFIAKRRAAKKQ